VTTIALLGLGEAGGTIAADLRAAGAEVRGWDPQPATGPDAADAPAAARGADVVLSLNSAADALDAARSVLGVLGPGQVLADGNTATPALKLELAALVEPTGATFADVALMAPVPGNGVRVPVLVSGSGAEAFAGALRPLGMPVELGGPQAGDAARHKLLRSIVWKGIAVVVLEATAAGDAAGEADWMRAEIEAVFASADAALLQRMLTGSRTHATRRVHEMEAVGELLGDLGVPSRTSDAAAAWLRDLRDGTR
jgi:3-hydroxyisobutyrate dehydrogenase-like beta-hydroxyacid dehydrogenase